MPTPHASEAADSGPVATHNALRRSPAMAVMAVPMAAGTITHASHGIHPVRGYSPKVTAAKQAIPAPATAARMRRFTRRG